MLHGDVCSERTKRAIWRKHVEHNRLASKSHARHVVGKGWGHVLSGAPSQTVGARAIPNVVTAASRPRPALGVGNANDPVLHGEACEQPSASLAACTALLGGGKERIIHGRHVGRHACHVTRRDLDASTQRASLREQITGVAVGLVDARSILPTLGPDPPLASPALGCWGLGGSDGCDQHRTYRPRRLGSTLEE